MTPGVAITQEPLQSIPSMLAIRDLRRRIQSAGPLGSVDRLGALLALDPAACCRALAMLVAPLHGPRDEGPSSIQELARAFGRVALRRVFDVPEIEIEGTQQLRVLWLHAIATACAARRLARATGVADPEHAYLAGLIHDLSRWTEAAVGAVRAPQLADELRELLALPDVGAAAADDDDDDPGLSTPPEETVQREPATLVTVAERIASLADMGHGGANGRAHSERMSLLSATSHEALVLAHEIRHDVEEALFQFGLGSIGHDTLVDDREDLGELFGRPARPAQTDMVLALLDCKRPSSYQAITTLATAAAVRFLEFDRAFYLVWHPAVDRCFVRTKTDLTRIPLVRAPIRPAAHERATLDAVMADGSPRVLESGAGPAGLSTWLGSGEMLVALLDRGTRSSSFLVLDRATSEREIQTANDAREVAALAGFVTLLIDNFRLRLHRLRARRDATIDPLTRLANRGFGMLALEQQVARARRAASPLCVLMVDLDEFKQLNDRLGHLAGDQALRVAAQVLRRNVRRADTVCRYGGEEFLIVLPDTGPQEASLLAARLFVAIEDDTKTEGIPVTASIGLASLRHGEDDVESLIDRADRALYASKLHGRNRFSADT